MAASCALDAARVGNMLKVTFGGLGAAAECKPLDGQPDRQRLGCKEHDEPGRGDGALAIKACSLLVACGTLPTEPSSSSERDVWNRTLPMQTMSCSSVLSAPESGQSKTALQN